MCLMTITINVPKRMNSVPKWGDSSHHKCRASKTGRPYLDLYGSVMNGNQKTISLIILRIKFIVFFLHFIWSYNVANYKSRYVL
jgi:hypothetical protein